MTERAESRRKLCDGGAAPRCRTSPASSNPVVAVTAQAAVHIAVLVLPAADLAAGTGRPRCCGRAVDTLVGALLRIFVRIEEIVTATARLHTDVKAIEERLAALPSRDERTSAAGSSPCRRHGSAESC